MALGGVQVAGLGGAFTALLLASAAGTGLAAPDPPPRQTAAAVFDQQRASHSSGLTLTIDYVNPDDPSAKPYAVQRTVTELAPGTTIDTSVPARCTASDAELATAGAAACPADSRVGTGDVVLDTGIAGPARMAENSVTLLNNKNELILLLESKSGPPTRFVTRAAIDGRSIVSDVPPIPGGPPDGFTAVKRVRLRTDAISSGSKSYLETPATCPADGWRNATTFTYRDGVDQTVVNPSSCLDESPGPPPDRTPPRIRISGVKRHGCSQRSFVVRVAISERGSGVARATLSLDGHRIASTQRTKFSRHIDFKRLAVGRHTLTATARDRSGNRARRTIRFQRCERHEDH